MAGLPITHMTLYKHGVGFFERRAGLSGESVKLAFRVGEMNDILKSLTVIDWGDGQVLGIDYATPQTRDELLAGCSIRLSTGRSLRDLLNQLRGRRVRLALEGEQTLPGTLLGLDELPERQPLESSLVSVLLDGSTRVETIALGRIRGVEVADERAADDLRFFLETGLGQEDFRQVTIRLTPGDHDLSVGYIAPAPTWRVSYRLVLDPEAASGPRALLLGWGIFDNRLEEDLEGISLALVAGMPISFVYDLYTPYTPERPTVKEERRVAAAPVEFAGAEAEAEPLPALGVGMDMARYARMKAPMAAASPERALREELADSTAVATTGKAMGELFQYVIGTPVTVGRGQSAMVPIISANLDYRKDLLYNGAKLPTHPVATLRFQNDTGLTLERGPVTVLGQSEYLGEALLPFSAAGAEVTVAHAVELGIKVREESGRRTEVHRLQVEGAYLQVEEWAIRWREYQVNNGGDRPASILVEHPRSSDWDLFDTPQPAEQTDEHLRFEVAVARRQEAKLRVQERQLTRRREELQRQSLHNLQRYLRQGLIDHRVHDQVAQLLHIWEQIADREKESAGLDKERAKVFQAQEQIRGNMKALGTSGEEGRMRASYVKRLEETESQLSELARRETALKAEIERLQKEVQARIEALK